MQFPYTCTGSLSPSFLPARDVSLPVKHPYAFALYIGRLPIGLRVPLEASVTLLEATTPVKLPTKQCPRNKRVRPQAAEGPYFKGGSAAPGDAAFLPPAYPTRPMTKVSAKLQ